MLWLGIIAAELKESSTRDAGACSVILFDGGQDKHHQKVMLEFASLATDVCLTLRAPSARRRSPLRRGR
jgi:hypothetical protein